VVAAATAGFCYNNPRVVEVAAGRPQRAIVVHRKEQAMLKLYLTLRNLWADKRGVTAIEYAVLAGAVAVGLAAVFATGETGIFAPLQTAIENAVSSTDPGT
jgi:Flp pilus assembly pilin Flp